MAPAAWDESRCVIGRGDKLLLVDRHPAGTLPFVSFGDATATIFVFFTEVSRLLQLFQTMDGVLLCGFYRVRVA